MTRNNYVDVFKFIIPALKKELYTNDDIPNAVLNPKRIFDF